MKNFEKENNISSGIDPCARAVRETVPMVMCAIRRTVTREQPLELTLPQVRSLNYLRRYDGSTLSELVKYLGLSPSSTSKLIDGLVQRGLVARGEGAHDRRQAALSLTAAGISAVEHANQVIESSLYLKLRDLSPDERAEVMRVMERLRGLFFHEHERGT